MKKVLGVGLMFVGICVGLFCVWFFTIGGVMQIWDGMKTSDGGHIIWGIIRLFGGSFAGYFCFFLLYSPGIGLLGNLSHIGYISFSSMEDFGIWRKDLIEIQGKLKPGTVVMLTSIHPGDQRIVIMFRGDHLPAEMLDRDAQIKYNFLVRSVRDVKEMGFKR